MHFEASSRLLPQINLNSEWSYLVNETLEGEKAIVPLLKEILSNPNLPKALKESLDQQLDEEIEHVRGYRNVLGGTNIASTGFGEMLKRQVRLMPSTALQLFSLQGMLEGIALGALRHRLKHWQYSPSYSMDLSAHADEERHVSLSWKHFAELIEAEGAVTREEFHRVEKSINKIFRTCFSGKALTDWVVANQFGQTNPGDAAVIDQSHSMGQFRKLSTLQLLETKNSFLKHYLEAAENVASKR